MNYSEQLEFYNFDDVYEKSRDINFAIIQLFGTSALPPMLLGQKKVQPNILRQSANVSR